MKKVLVTGADGFIGSHLAEQLLEKGYDTRAFVYYNSFGSWGGWIHCRRKKELRLKFFPEISGTRTESGLQ